ncbi:Clavaminate synthase-like protein [Meredithblackwellia eburnea MCA 4105]
MTELQLPLIDLSPFLTPSNSSDKQRTSCAEAVHNACAKFGFMYLTGFDSVVPYDQFDTPLEVAREFFLRPSEEKQAIRIRQPDGARGYQVLGENVTQYKADHHEGWDAYKPLPPTLEDPQKLLHGPNLWPSQPTSFRPTMEQWVEKMKVIGMALMEATAIGLGMDLGGEEWKKLRGSVEDSFWVMRSIAYPPLPGDTPGISCGEHKDYGMWTLWALQVFLNDPSGDEERSGLKGRWIDANPVKNAFVVNIGEMWEVLTNGLYKATLHRVIHKGSNLRVSLPFFYEPNFDAVIEPLPSALKLQRASPDQKDALDNPKKSTVYGKFLAGKVSGNFGEVDG